MFINNNEFYQEIGSRIRNARNLANVSQDDLAIRLGLTRASIINIEKGRHKPSLHVLLEIASMLMVNYISLIPDSTSSFPHETAFSTSIDLNNIVSDQPGMDNPTKETVERFIQSIQK